MVVTGSARLVSGLATRLRPEEGLLLPSGYVEGWRELRAELEGRRESRRKQRRFRCDPAGYLTQLEQRCLQLRSGNRITFRFAERSGIIDYNVIWQPSLLVMDVGS